MRAAALLCLVVAMMVAQTRGAAACPIAGFQQAVQSRSLPAIVAASRTLDGSAAGCTAAQRAWAGRIVALAHAAEADGMIRRGADPAEAMASVDTGLRYAQPWPLLKIKGDLLQRIPAQQGRPNWLAASDAYQRALTDIDEEGTPPAPVEMIEQLLRLAQQTQMLAADLVSPPKTRNGKPGGLWLPSVRGFAVTAVAQPIHFQYNSTAFTELGRRAADTLVEVLREQGNPSILLVGHTDPDGSPDYNRNLSLRRAEAVRNHLVATGYPADRIGVDGRGEDQPLTIEGGNIYSKAELYQMLRRVELVRQ